MNENVGEKQSIVTPPLLRNSGDLSQAMLAKRVQSFLEAGKQVGHIEEFFNEKSLVVTRVEFKTSATGQHEEISRTGNAYDQLGNTLKSTWENKESQEIVESSYDAAGRLLKIVGKTHRKLTDGTVVNHEMSELREYNADGNLIKADFQLGKHSESIVIEWDSSGKIASTAFLEGYSRASDKLYY